MAVEFGKWQKIERRNTKVSSASVYFKGWWTDLNDAPLKKSFFGETVRFHITVNNSILNGKEIDIQFYDSD